MKIIRISLLFLVGGLSCLQLSAQRNKLADNYMKNGEYGKAAEIYADLYQSSKSQTLFLSKWVEALEADQQSTEAQKTLEKEIKNHSEKSELLVLLGSLQENQNNINDAEESYDKAIQELTSNVSAIRKTANRFKKLGRYDRVLETYAKGRILSKDPTMFALEMADAHRNQSKIVPMIDEYLHYAEQNPKRLSSVQTLLQNYLSPSHYDTLAMLLYERLQSSDAIEYTELLAWTFVQKEDYSKALRQFKALDRRLQENGQRVFKISETALNAQDYETAISGYTHILDKGPDATTLYLKAQERLLYTKRKRIVVQPNPSEDALLDLQQEYIAFLDAYGWNSSSAEIIMELAELEALHRNDLEAAIGYLEDLVQLESLKGKDKAKVKINLADYYLMTGEIWESTLLYSQVDKEFREQLIGQEARYKNAKLSYYNGNFEWAQEQFNVLKSSTSRMIANDAIDLSVFITDNFGLDTSRVPMELFAKTDLLILQNRFDRALEVLDSIQTLYPDHKLDDDILYNRGQIYYKLQDYNKAIESYNLIVEKHSDEIRADNALFNLGYIYENVLEDNTKAMEAYSKIFLEHADSTFAIEARKKYRLLRGDDI